jgi:hypothetical protein
MAVNKQKLATTFFIEQSSETIEQILNFFRAHFLKMGSTEIVMSSVRPSVRPSVRL